MATAAVVEAVTAAVTEAVEIGVTGAVAAVVTEIAADAAVSTVASATLTELLGSVYAEIISSYLIIPAEGTLAAPAYITSVSSEIALAADTYAAWGVTMALAADINAANTKCSTQWWIITYAGITDSSKVFQEFE
jgi:hypothetical protein